MRCCKNFFSFLSEIKKFINSVNEIPNLSNASEKVYDLIDPFRNNSMMDEKEVEKYDSLCYFRKP